MGGNPCARFSLQGAKYAIVSERFLREKLTKWSIDRKISTCGRHGGHYRLPCARARQESILSLSSGAGPWRRLAPAR